MFPAANIRMLREMQCGHGFDKLERSETLSWGRRCLTESWGSARVSWGPREGKHCSRQRESHGRRDVVTGTDGPAGVATEP